MSSTSPQYGELRPTSGWDLSSSLRHPRKFQRVSRLGSITAQHLVAGISQTLRRWTEGATLWSAGRLPRWALAHILVLDGCAAPHTERKTFTQRWGCWNFHLAVNDLFINLVCF